MSASVEELEAATLAVPAPSPQLAAELAAADERLDGRHPLEVLSWAVGRFGHDLVLASSFQDCVLVDLVMRVDRRVAVLFIDTGFHFAETLAYLRRIERRYGIEVTVVSAGLPPEQSPCGTANCCQLRKVAPLNAFLAGRPAWVSGLKRVDTPERRQAPVVGWDAARGLVKVNPLAGWSEEDVEDYVVARDLPPHPLNSVGYLSIGCEPATEPVAEGDDPRAGRWAGTAKTECGLHL